jgi:hypothetical protein
MAAASSHLRRMKNVGGERSGLENSRKCGLVGALFLSSHRVLEVLRRGKAPGGFQSTAQRRLSDPFQAHVRAASPSPRTGTWIENARLSLDEHLLFKGCEFDHGVVFVRVAESGEKFSCDAKVWMVHV